MSDSNRVYIFPAVPSSGMGWWYGYIVSVETVGNTTYYEVRVVCAEKTKKEWRTFCTTEKYVQSIRSSSHKFAMGYFDSMIAKCA